MNNDNFVYSFPIILFLICFSLYWVLAKSFITMLNRSDSWLSCLTHYLKKNISLISPLSLMFVFKEVPLNTKFASRFFKLSAFTCY